MKKEYAIINNLGESFWENDDRKFYPLNKFDLFLFDDKSYAEQIRKDLIEDLTKESEEKYSGISSDEWKKNIELREIEEDKH